MLLFQRRFHEGLISGAVTLTFRLWPRCRVKPGSRYRCHPIGVLVVDAVDRVPLADIDDSDANRAGFSDKRALVTYLKGLSDAPISGSTEIFKVALHYGGKAILQQPPRRPSSRTRRSAGSEPSLPAWIHRAAAGPGLLKPWA